MAKTLLTLPGKIGDNLLKLPAVAAYAAQNHTAVDLCLDEGSRCMKSLVESAWFVDKVFFRRVRDYNMGGQPIDFGCQFEREYEVVKHLGYKTFPNGDIVQDTLCELNLKPAVWPGYPKSEKPFYICVHVESSRHQCNVDCCESILPILSSLKAIVPVVALTVYDTTNPAVQNAYAPWGNIEFLNDHGHMGETAKLLSQSLLIGTYSSMASLSHAINSRQIVIVDGRETLGHWQQPRYPGMSVIKHGNPQKLLELARSYF